MLSNEYNKTKEHIPIIGPTPVFYPVCPIIVEVIRCRDLENGAESAVCQGSMPLALRVK